MRIKLSPFAEDDLQESIDFYNLQKEKLGFEFAKEVNDTFERLRSNYLQYPEVHKKLRKARLNRFPFNVFFVVEPPIVYVLAVFHTSRNPNLLKSRFSYK